MNLSQVIVSGCVAAVFGIIVECLRKKGWISKTQGWTILLITIALWNVGAYFLIKAQLKVKLLQVLNLQSKKYHILE